MEFRLLGPFEVVHGGRVVALGGLREHQVLALLLLAPNQVVSSERLIEDLWSGHPPAGAVRALRVFVSRLRAALRAAGGDEIVHTRSPGYLVQVTPTALDVAVFESALGRARRATDAGDHAEAAAELRAGLALWRGDPLPDLVNAPNVRAEIGRLDELRVSALERRIEADLSCGSHAHLVAELDGLTREYPLRERLWAARMLALYRCGRQAEALAAYGAVRTVLAEDLGLDPGVELIRMEAAILRHDPQLEWPPAPAVAPARQPVAAAAEAVSRRAVDEARRPARRFVQRAPYVGRIAEREELRGLLGTAISGHGTLVLVGGEAGVGKTRLTQELAAEATTRGARCHFGHCYEGEGVP